MRLVFLPVFHRVHANMCAVLRSHSLGCDDVYTWRQGDMYMDGMEQHIKACTSQQAYTTHHIRIAAG